MEEFFITKEVLGSGSQAVVRKVERRSDGKIFACKSYRLSKYRFSEPFDGGCRRSDVEAEIGVMERLSQCDKNGTVRLVEVFREQDYYHLVMELCLYSLQHLMYAKKVFGEDEAAVVMRSLGRQVSKLHDLGIVHRDIKPENVLVAPGELDGFDYKLADFGVAGLCKMSGVHINLREEAGTRRYMAPEMLPASRLYDERVDEWGLGLVLYEMLTGKIAFQELSSEDEVARRLMRLEDLPVNLLDFSTVSEEARNLILHLLTLDPKKRLLAADIDQHPWVVKNSNAKSKQDRESAERETARPVAKRRWYVRRGQQAEEARKRLCT